MWTEHGGSGLGLSYGETEELDVVAIAWLFARLREQRKKEADAIKRR